MKRFVCAFGTDFIELSICAEYKGQDVQDLDPDHGSALIPDGQREIILVT